MSAGPGPQSEPPRRLPRLAAALLITIGLASLWRTPGTMPRDLAIRLVATYAAALVAVVLLTRRPADGWSRRFALMTGAIAFTIAVIELPAFVGLVDYESLFPANRVEPFLGRHDRSDSELLRLHPPYLHEVGTTQGDLVVSTNTHVSWAPWYDYDVRYDAHGFRNQADRHRAEVAVIGDSFVEGVQVPFRDLMTTVLERHLGTSVANLGQIGYGPREELAVLKRFAAPLRPSTCVWCFFEGNDLTDLRNPDRHGPTCTVRHSLGERSFLKNALLATIRLAGLDRSRYDDFMARSGIVPRPGGSNRRMFFFYPGHPVSDDDRQALKDLGGILDRAWKVCHENGMRLVVVFIPTKFHVYGDLCRFAPESPCRTWSVGHLEEPLRATVAEVSSQIGFLDMTGPFHAEAEKGALLYYPDDTHWSPEGQRLAGHLLSDYLSSTPDAAGR